MGGLGGGVGADSVLMVSGGVREVRRAGRFFGVWSCLVVVGFG
jgi:hypothetical protein